MRVWWLLSGRESNIIGSSGSMSNIGTRSVLVLSGCMMLALMTAFTLGLAHSSPVVSVNAASFTAAVAPGSIAAGFGDELAISSVEAASLPLPVELAGTSVRLVDADQNEHFAPLFFVSPGQINYLIPDGIAVGTVHVSITNSAGTVSTGELTVANSAPAIFTFTADGRGVPVALTTFDGAAFEPVVNPDGSARLVDPGTMWHPNYLALFGTGLGRATNIRVRVGGVEITPMYAGPQGNFAGLDQINLALPANLAPGVVDLMIAAGGTTSNSVQLRLQGANVAQAGLTEADVQSVIARAVARAQQLGFAATVSVVDHEGTVLGVFRMTGAPATTRIGAFNLQTGLKLKPADSDGLQDLLVPAEFAAISKAGTAAFFSTQGNAFTSRTASFIIQEHLPPLIDFQAGGPLFGVQFSQLPCSDIKVPNLPLGLAGDPGGVPLYKNGIAAGGIGIEGDNFYSIDIDPSDLDQSPEEIVAVAGTLGFEAPGAIRGDEILVDGIRLPFVNATQSGGAASPFNTLPGSVDARFPVRGAGASRFRAATLGGVLGRVDDRFFPAKSSESTTAQRLIESDVTRLLTQAAQQAARTRAAIRRPLGSPAEVNIAVVDIDGRVLGVFSTADAPIFGFDVCVQKARTAAFFSNSAAGTLLRAAESGRFAKFVDAAAADGIRMDGSVAFTDRANGFLSRPFFPDGINGTANGPFSKPIGVWSPFNDGLQVALVQSALLRVLAGQPVTSCTAIPNLRNGIQLFAGSVPIYKNGVLVGAIGVSGDGIDQDDMIAASGSVGFEAPEGIRADQIFVRGVRLPYVKFPRHPNL
ncbi:MAG: heme-binding protein [Acidobacteriota bacterium]